ncbi:SDR family oxidoreductase [Novispirillum itersonii]|uniref:SDR family oxidoreductase n=1 Tax=Novispirillum itersonii TaxID=189 RepID=UPI000375DE15|nr:SDR family oxidoreductase [Novispirillum itersonii]
MSRHLFCFGLGYSARVLARRLLAEGWTVSGTVQDPARNPADGITLHAYSGAAPLPETVFDGVTHVLSSVPPAREGGDTDTEQDGGDPVLRHHAALLRQKLHDGSLQWAGYLSTTGVYGDHGGNWVDEDTPIDPDLPRSARRARAEAAWLALGGPVHAFRLAGIYGPGRSALDSMRSGTARRVIKPGQVFCRIHVDDIAAVVRASLLQPNPGRIYNVCDDEPAPPQDVIAHAATLLGLPVPPDLPIEQAALSPMAASFYADNRRVRNTRIKQELGVTLTHPTYRHGLETQLAGQSRAAE